MKVWLARWLTYHTLFGRRRAARPDEIDLYAEIVDAARASVERRYAGARFDLLIWDDEGLPSHARVLAALQLKGLRLHRMADILPGCRSDKGQYEPSHFDHHSTARARVADVPERDFDTIARGVGDKRGVNWVSWLTPEDDPWRFPRDVSRRASSTASPSSTHLRPLLMRIFVAGGGQSAELIARRLIREGNDLVILEEDAARCVYLEAHLDAQVVQGNVCSFSAWRRAGISTAELVIAATDSDETNVLACLIADAEAPDAIKALRLHTWEFRDWEKMLKARGVRVDRVIHPETDIVGRIYNVLAVPGVSDIRDFADGKVKLFGMNVEQSNWLAGKSLSDLVRAGPPQNTMVAMIFRGREFIIPHGDEVLRPWDHIYVATTRQNFDATLRFMGIEKQRAVQRAFIVGGGEAAIAIAKLLEERGVAVKIFEKDAAYCEHIAGILEKSVVIHADGSDQETLLQENVEGVDAFLALTDDDNANLVVSLLARQLGARKVVALVNRVHNLLMAQRLGINSTVSRRVKAVDAILELVRKGGVLSVRTFREEEAEAIEVIAPASSRYVGLPLRELNFPRGTIVGAIVSRYGEVIIPRGNAVIAAGDRVVFFAAESCVAQLESEFLATASEA